jgi:FlaA1/EpsC-like NDP-sugar epimerase
MTADALDGYRHRRVLITGGAGFIGSNLPRRLVDPVADAIPS